VNIKMEREGEVSVQEWIRDFQPTNMYVCIEN
jgi:hypothetical protein